MNQSFDEVSDALRFVEGARRDKEVKDSIKNYFKSTKACEKLVNADLNRNEIFEWWGICKTFLQTDQELININLRNRLSEKMAFEKSSYIDRPACIEIYKKLEEGLKETNTDPKKFLGDELFSKYSKVSAEYEQEWNNAVRLLVGQQQLGMEEVYTKKDAELALKEEVTRNRCSNPMEWAQHTLSIAEELRNKRRAEVQEVLRKAADFDANDLLKVQAVRVPGVTAG